MSVIHIENFPLSGNIASVREFFSGLSIPEGGVHILGGPRGDAFVVFDTPQDAKNSLRMDRRRIHGCPVTIKQSCPEMMADFINQSNQRSNGPGVYNIHPGQPQQMHFPPSGPPTFRPPHIQEPRNLIHVSEQGRSNNNGNFGSGNYSQQSSEQRGSQDYNGAKRNQPQFPWSSPPPNLLHMPNIPKSDYPPGRGNVQQGYQRGQSTGRTREGSPGRGSRDRDERMAVNSIRGVGGTLERLNKESENRGDFSQQGRREDRKDKFLDDNPFSTCVVVSNFPIYISKMDIRNKYFGDCKLTAGGLKIITDARMGTRKAYMKFRGPADTQLALKRNGLQADNKTLVVRTCSAQEFDKAVENYIPPKTDDKPKQIQVNIKHGHGNFIGPRPTKKAREDPPLCVLASNMPNDIGPRDMKLFFHNSEIEDNGIQIMKSQDGKGIGKAYIKFRRPADAEKALNRSGSQIDSCRVVVSKCTVEDFNDAVAKMRKIIAEIGADVFARVSNLPSDVGRRDLTLFFHQSKLASDGINIRRDQRKKGPAEAHIRFLTPEDVTNALMRDGDFIDGKRISVQRCTQNEYNQAVGFSPAAVKTPSLCTIISNLPSDAKQRDLTLFFHSSSIAQDGIKLMHDDRDRLTGTAYVKFRAPRDIENALKMNGSSIEDKRIAVHRCSHEEFDKAVERPRRNQSRTSLGERDNTRKETSRRDEKKYPLYAYMSNLPKDISQRDITLFFQGVELARDGIKIQTDKHGKGLGKVYVKFASDKDAKAGFERHNRKIEQYKVSIKECPFDEYKFAIDGSRREENPDVMSQFPTPPLGMLDLHQGAPRCVYVSNIPPDCNYHHVQQFFHNCQIVPNGIKLQPSRFKPGLKEAFVKFAEAADMGQALNRDGQQVGPLVVGVKVCSHDEFERGVLLSGIPDFAAAAPGMMNLFQQQPNQFLPSMDITVQPQGPLIQPGIPNPTHPLVIGPSEGDIRIVQERRDNNMINVFDPFNKMEQQTTPPNLAVTATDLFEAYCVSLRNVPYAATAQDIVDFLSPANISIGPIMKVKANGMNTGKVDVQFSTQYDQELAMQKNRQSMAGRIITILPISPQDFAESCERFGIKSGTARHVPDAGMAPDSCVSIENLPDYTEAHHLRELFRQSDIARDGIHIFYFGSGKATGAAYVEFASPRDQERALKSNNRKIGSKTVTVKSVSKSEMEHRLAIRRNNLGLIGANIPNVTEAMNDFTDDRRGPPRDNHRRHDNAQRNRNPNETNRPRDYDERRRSTSRNYEGGFSSGPTDGGYDDDMQLDYYEDGYPEDIARHNDQPPFQNYQSSHSGSQSRDVDERRPDRKSPRNSRPSPRGPSPRSRRSPDRRESGRARSQRSRSPVRQQKTNGRNNRRPSPARKRAPPSDRSRPRPGGPPPRQRNHGNTPLPYVRIQNLSDDVQMEDLVEFVRANNVFPDTIELQCMENSMKEEGIAMFRSVHDAQKAVRSLNNRVFRERIAKVFIGRSSDP